MNAVLTSNKLPERTIHDDIRSTCGTPPKDAKLHVASFFDNYMMQKDPYIDDKALDKAIEGKKEIVAQQNRLIEVDGHVSKHTARSITIFQHKKNKKKRPFSILEAYYHTHTSVQVSSKASGRGTDEALGQNTGAEVDFLGRLSHSNLVKLLGYCYEGTELLLWYNAKLSDFGLGKIGPSASQSHVTTCVMGTCGYAAPE
ncbi:hypothetical protein CTI12_AA356460 [Artemisia annua]|uniref:Serine-threonine/tyrosine-protein kinase catalytic domain-containing protein n=1 Tax=Artemisia annua TaxID=35608 RepID=A0A2U1MPQ8_ARTAN|nr:hypothetical protein CTI12_AA356460 [Artemisia annua]